MNTELPIAFYGDDFTGSTDAMEALALAGMRAVLFLEPPPPERLAQFPGVQAVGVAGVSRSLPTEEMAAELRPFFTGLRKLNPTLVHYKICSTFDSSPYIGSIGEAIEIGRVEFGGDFTPLVVGAPVLGRYVAFGNLFARSGPESPVYRLDRHPTMRHHPVTPMAESDLGRHLAEQSERSIGQLMTPALEHGLDFARQMLTTLKQQGTDVLLFDTITDAHLRVIGGLLWEEAEQNPPLFVVGSSGVEYALVAHWRETGHLLDLPPPCRPGRVEQILVVSGSCSPVTAQQIAYAAERDYVVLPLAPDRLLNPTAAHHEIASVVQEVRKALVMGRNVLLHTCQGPDDPRITAAERAIEALGYRGNIAKREMGRRLGTALGDLMRAALEKTRVQRAVVTGGDTSGYVARALGIESLELVAPVAPGSPLCHVTSSSPRIQGMEILFKGGQVGKVSLFEDVRRGIR
jgi:uncharacterized protein YgbK (DUF1537 family)